MNTLSDRLARTFLQTYVGPHADHSPLKLDDTSQAAWRASVKVIAIDSVALGESRNIHVYTGRLCAKLGAKCLPSGGGRSVLGARNFRCS